MGLALKCVNKSTVYLPKNKYADFHVFGGSVSVRKRLETSQSRLLLKDNIQLACEASVSLRGSSRKLGQEQKLLRNNSIGNACYAG